MAHSGLKRWRGDPEVIVIEELDRIPFARNQNV